MRLPHRVPARALLLSGRIYSPGPRKCSEQDRETPRLPDNHLAPSTEASPAGGRWGDRKQAPGSTELSQQHPGVRTCVFTNAPTSRRVHTELSYLTAGELDTHVGDGGTWFVLFWGDDG